MIKYSVTKHGAWLYKIIDNQTGLVVYYGKNKDGSNKYTFNDKNKAERVCAELNSEFENPSNYIPEP